jgi:hypothetical protein
MSSDAQTRREGRLRLGFLTNVPITSDAGAADDALQLADELMIWLPPNFTLAENKELLDNIVAFIAPELGWQPANAAVAR